MRLSYLAPLLVMLNSSCGHPRQQFHLCAPMARSDLEQTDVPRITKWADGWTASIVPRIGRVNSLYPGTDPVSLQGPVESLALTEDRRCRTLAGSACYGEPSGGVYCSQETIARLFHAIALTAANYSMYFGQDDDPVAILDFSKALAVVDAKTGRRPLPHSLELELQQGSMKARLDHALAIAEGIREMEETGRSSDLEAVQDAGWLYQKATFELLSFVLGHELFHAQSGCALEDTSWVESSGNLERVIRLQSEPPLCADGHVTPQEVAADECGFRALARADAMVEADLRGRLGSGVGGLSSLYNGVIVRTLSIDAFSHITTFGLGGAATEKKETNALSPAEFPPQRGYLSQPLRLFLFAAELQNSEKYHRDEVALCSGSAERFASGIEHKIESCVGRAPDPPIRERLAREFAGPVAGSVIDRWRQGTSWFDTTSPAEPFVCTAEGRCRPRRRCER